MRFVALPTSRPARKNAVYPTNLCVGLGKSVFSYRLRPMEMEMIPTKKPTNCTEE